MDQDGVKVHKRAKKRKKKAWSIKDLSFGFRGNFSQRTQQVVPSGQDSSILQPRVANHSRRFGLSSPAHGARHIIKMNVQKMTYLNSEERYESISDHHSYLVLISSCEIKA